MCMLDMTEADYRREENGAEQYARAEDALMQYHRQQTGWETINDLVAAGLLNLDDLVAHELANGEY